MSVRVYIYAIHRSITQQANSFRRQEEKRTETLDNKPRVFGREKRKGRAGDIRRRMSDVGCRKYGDLHRNTRPGDSTKRGDCYLKSSRCFRVISLQNQIRQLIISDPFIPRLQFTSFSPGTDSERKRVKRSSSPMSPAIPRFSVREVSATITISTTITTATSVSSTLSVLSVLCPLPEIVLSPVALQHHTSLAATCIEIHVCVCTCVHGVGTDAARHRMVRRIEIVLDAAGFGVDVSAWRDVCVDIVGRPRCRRYWRWWSRSVRRRIRSGVIWVRPWRDGRVAVDWWLGRWRTRVGVVSVRALQRWRLAWTHGSWCWSRCLK